MFVQDLRQDFYNQLIGKRLLIIVNSDIDGICASKILQSLFKNDHVLYSVVPIMGLAGLQRAYNEYQGDVKHFLLLNCGGNVNIIEFLQPSDDCTFYICDVHRPYDIYNIYSREQIRIISESSKEEHIPAFESIFCNSYEENINNLNDKGIGISEKDKNDTKDISNLFLKSSCEFRNVKSYESSLIKQMDHRKWEEERDRLIFEYTQFTYYGRSSALAMFELAWKLSKDNMDFLWWAIVGITELLILGKIESSTYTVEIHRIQSHVNRLTNKIKHQTNVKSAKIKFENDLHLVLYRHWNVLESMRYSRYLACKLQLWTFKGERKLHELLVEMGLPLIHARQKFNSMDLILRQEFYTMIVKLADKYDIPDITYGSFILHYGYRNRYSAADYVFSLLAILESIKKNKTPENCFLQTLDALSRNHKNLLDDGIEYSKIFHIAIYKQVQLSLEAHQIYSKGSFFYFILNKENTIFSYPYGLTMLAKFLLNSYITISHNRLASNMPMIASSLLDNERGICLLVGIPPVQENSSKSFFGKAFEHAADSSKSIILQDFCDNSLIQIRQKDLTRFLDALAVLLT